MALPFKDLSNEELAAELGYAALQGRLVFTIDRGGDTNDCFYQVNAVSVSRFAFKDEKIILWADDVPLWGDVPGEEPSVRMTETKKTIEARLERIEQALRLVIDARYHYTAGSEMEQTRLEKALEALDTVSDAPPTDLDLHAFGESLDYAYTNFKKDHQILMDYKDGQGFQETDENDCVSSIIMDALERYLEVTAKSSSNAAPREQEPSEKD